MAKDKNSADSPLGEVLFHYNLWREDNDTRRTRKNGWNDVTDAYWGKLPDDWPYESRVVDPLIRTSVVEKDSRLLNAKLRGRLVPREGGDMLGARINNALLDFQWDNANEGGTMLSKWRSMSQDGRLYASSFGFVPWKYECDDKGDVLFNGNEFQKLDIRNCGMDPNCTHIRDARWFQIRSWQTVDDLELKNDLPDGKLKYPGLAELKSKLSTTGDRRDNEFSNRVLQLKGLTDRMGEDRVFPVVEIVTEYRKNRWITFAPKYKVVLRDIPNPYEHHKIPVVQLRYYELTGDPIGESEVEPVLPLWRAIQSNLCGYLDSMNIHNRPPLKIIDGQVRIETIVFGPEAQWLMDRADSVTEFQGSDQPMALFQTTHAALVQAFNNAMGDISQGISNIDQTKPDKTATEIRQTQTQQNTRDEMNQTSLSEALQDMMSMWLSNNKQFLFADPNMKEYIIRIVGSDLYNYFQRAGLDEMELAPEATQAVGDIISQQDGNVSDDDIQQLMEAGMTPKYPVIENPEEKNPEKLIMKPKMRVNETNDGAELSVVPDDVNGMYDYIPDVKSMSAGAGKEQQEGVQSAVETILNPQVMQMLMQEGVQPKIKDLLIANLEAKGLTDAERFFPAAQPQPVMPGQVPGQPPAPLDPSMGQPLAPMSPEEAALQQPAPVPQPQPTIAQPPVS